MQIRNQTFYKATVTQILGPLWFLRSCSAGLCAAKLVRVAVDNRFIQI